MTFEIGLLLGILAVSLVLFSIEYLPADAIALGVMLALVLTGLLPPQEAFAGFGSDSVIMILGLLILTAALMRTGVVDRVGQVILRRAGDDAQKLLLVIMIAAASLSAFMSNTASAAFFLPVTLGLARRLRLSPAQFLMPLAFAAILASSVTLVSSSTNIVVSGLMTRYGLAPLGMFELSPLGIPIAILGLAYMYFLGRRLIPDRIEKGTAEDTFGIHPYLTEVVVLPDSPLAGKTLTESGLGRDLDLTVLKVQRANGAVNLPRGNLKLQPGDTLLVEALRDDLLKVKDAVGIDIKADVKFSDASLRSEDLVEVILLPGSPFIGKTLKKLQLRERYDLQVLGISSHGKTMLQKISRVRFRVGDQLLIQGNRHNVALLGRRANFRILSEVDEPRPNFERAPLAAAIFAGALLLATIKVFSLPVAVLLGAFLVFATGCITPQEAYNEIEWKALILVGSMLALGSAMESTGAAAYLAGQIVNVFGWADPLLLLSAFFALTMLLTQPMSNQAAAIVVVPVAVQAALQMGLNPRTFAVMIAIGASCSYITPLEPATLMVYGPGGYRFLDFLKVGSILTVLIYLLAIVLVPVFWPL